jgi:hypothetical protein
MKGFAMRTPLVARFWLACGAVPALVVALLARPALAEDTCPDPANEPRLDGLVLDQFGCTSDWKDWFAPFFNLQKEQWDEGWGWNQPTNLFREFGRMCTASRVLNQGVSDRVQGWWPETYGFPSSGFPPRPTNPTEPQAAGRIAAAFSDQATLHLLYRSTANSLHHITLQPYEGLPLNLQPQNITDLLGPSSPAGLPMITGDPVLVNSPDSRLWVLTAGGVVPDRVLLFKQQVGTSWLVAELTPQPVLNTQFTISRPAVVALSPGAFAVFGINPDRKLVRYVYSQTYVNAMDLPAAGTYPNNLEHGTLAAVAAGGAMHVFGVNHDTGHIFHFQADSPSDAMTFEDLSTIAKGSPSVASYSPLTAIGDADGRIVVYGRSWGGHLIRLARNKKYVQLTTGTVFVGYEWVGEDLSTIAKVEPPPVGIQAPIPIEINVSVMRETAMESDVFGVSAPGGELVYFTRRPNQGWHQTLIAVGPGGPRLQGEPSAVIEPDGVQRVLGRTSTGQLFFAERASESAPWNAYDLPTHLALSQQEWNSYAVEPGYWVTTLRSEGHRHVVAWRPGRRALLSVFDTQAFAWHNSLDYANWAAGSLHGFRYQPQNQRKRDDKTYDAWAYAGIFRTDRVEMWCPSFDEDAGPSRRAGTMVHEATHILYAGIFDVWKHHNIDGVDKDDWLPYVLGQIPHGTMNGGSSGHKQSMYQIQAMFNADIAEFSAPWVPLDIRSQARSDANAILGSRFVTDPGWRVGEPRPLLSCISPESSNATTCLSNAECENGWTCQPVASANGTKVQEPSAQGELPPVQIKICEPPPPKPPKPCEKQADCAQGEACMQGKCVAY